MKTSRTPQSARKRPAGTSTPLGRFLSFCAIILAPLTATGSTVINFDDLSLPEDSFWNGSDGSGGFMSSGAAFNNHFEAQPEWETWSGWSYSNVVDTETAGFENQYAAITGGGIGNNGIYGVAFVDVPFDDDFEPTFPRIDLPSGTHPVSMRVTNTTYTYHTINEGDDFAKQFSTEDNDWFRLHIRGLDGEGNETGTLPEFYLADYRFDDPEDAYIIDEWVEIDLSSLGEATRSLEFSLSSSDVGDFGMNTPAYFAMGELTAVPEPAASGVLVGACAIGFAVFLHRRLKKGT